MTDLNTRDIERIVSRLKARNFPTAARTAAEALAPGPIPREPDRCTAAGPGLRCYLVAGHEDRTGHNHYDRPQNRYFRFLAATTGG